MCGVHEKIEMCGVHENTEMYGVHGNSEIYGVHKNSEIYGVHKHKKRNRETSNGVKMIGKRCRVEGRGNKCGQL